jgi:hypothetical protein
MQLSGMVGFDNSTHLTISSRFISGPHLSNILYSTTNRLKFLPLVLSLLNLQLYSRSVSLILNILTKCERDMALFSLYQGEHLDTWKHLESLPKKNKIMLCILVSGIMGHRQSLNHQHVFQSLKCFPLRTRKSLHFCLLPTFIFTICCSNDKQFHLKCYRTR